MFFAKVKPGYYYVGIYIKNGHIDYYKTLDRENFPQQILASPGIISKRNNEAEKQKPSQHMENELGELSRHWQRNK